MCCVYIYIYIYIKVHVWYIMRDSMYIIYIIKYAYYMCMCVCVHVRACVCVCACAVFVWVCASGRVRAGVCVLIPTVFFMSLFIVYTRRSVGGLYILIRIYIYTRYRSWKKNTSLLCVINVFVRTWPQASDTKQLKNNFFFFSSSFIFNLRM